MVTQAIGAAIGIASTISGVLAALDRIKAARKDCDKLAKAGLEQQARALGRELDKQEARLKRSLARAIARKIRQRRKARQSGRDSSGRFTVG